MSFIAFELIWFTLFEDLKYIIIKLIRIHFFYIFAVLHLKIRKMRNFEQTIGNIADKSASAFICYIDEDGCPVTKAMLKPREHDGIRTFYFTTNTSSNKVKCFKLNPKASIYLVNPRLFQGASLTGTMEVLETAEAKGRIWRQGDEMYYPEGVTDPDYCVLKFTATKGRFYSDFHSDDFEIK